MRAVCIITTILFAAALAPAHASTANSLNDVFAQATAADQSTAKKRKSKRKPAPKVEYMRAVPYR